jgi:exodeoxyribonuclease VII small subunit
VTEGAGRGAGEPTFEEARAELERIVAQLESGEAGLEDAIALWERGEELYRLCLSKLEAAQGRVEELGRATGNGGDGEAGTG